MNFNINIDKLKELILKYANIHELAVECGSEYIVQSDEALIDAMDLVCHIFDECIDGKE